MIEISIVIPVFNEQDTITELHNRLQASVSSITPNYELIFVNDGSKDFTLLKLIELAEHDSRVKYISFSRNFGHQIALSAGLDHCKGKAVVLIDGDLQDPPELIPALYKKYIEGYEVVYARRTKRRGETLLKRTTAKLFYRTMKRITSFDIPLDVGDFRLVDRKIVEYLKQMPEQNKFLRGQIAWLGFRQTFVDYERDSRKAGQTGYPLVKMIRLALDGITAFSDSPLRLVTNLGLSISLVAFIIILYALYSHYFLHQTITGWTSLIISSMFIGGIQLLSIGIIGEYISRINSNVRNRPLYIVEKTNVDSKEGGSSN
jgi:dolichol-phosphate mannosyltransferase